MAAALAGCGGGGDEVPVVGSAPLSTEPWIATSIANGARLAVDEINRRGGIRLKAGPKRLKLVVLDNASSPATALANAREAVSRHAAVLLTDGTGATAVADVTDAAKLPAFILFNGGAPLIEPPRPPSMFPPAPAPPTLTPPPPPHHPPPAP